MAPRAAYGGTWWHSTISHSRVKWWVLRYEQLPALRSCWGWSRCQSCHPSEVGTCLGLLEVTGSCLSPVTPCPSDDSVPAATLQLLGTFGPGKDAGVSKQRRGHRKGCQDQQAGSGAQRRMPGAPGREGSLHWTPTLGEQLSRVPDQQHPRAGDPWKGSGGAAAPKAPAGPQRGRSGAVPEVSGGRTGKQTQAG